ncbi:restriction endonuclease subunit S [Aciduricibacillus chroicocephali]|uniref:Restriction endonuclease subunit S n=1 Tax=Aciduricibacillus chroicocephali TaxID=3054939 RepID=A0ABY9KUY7_9BACI|nr:restriction endonuclease subunit S [Bacillaceae bacterium 44XB]
MVSENKKVKRAKAFTSKIPNGWTVYSLNELLSLIRNGTSEKQNQEKVGQPVTRIETIANRVIDFNKVGFIDESINIEKYKLHRGDILFSHINSVKHIGKVALYDTEKTLYHGMNLLLLRPNEKVVSKYLFYLLSSYSVKKYYESNAKQAVNQASLNQYDVQSFTTAYPPVNEQQKIAAILLTIDNAIEKTEQIIEQTETVKKGLVQQLMTKGIGHTEFKNTSIGKVPLEWNIKTFNELLNENVISSIQDGNHGSIHPKSADYVKEGIPFIMANNLHSGEVDIKNCSFISKEQAEKLRKGFSYPGDVLLSHKGTVGRVAIVPGVSDYVMLTPQVTFYRIDNENVLLKEYLALYFRSEKFQGTLKKLSSQSTRSYIGITNQKKLSITLPNIEEQKKITKMMSSWDEMLKNEELKKKKLTILKLGLMQQLLTGNVRVPINDNEEVPS